MRLREYAGPLGVLMAGVFGLSLLCSVSGLATSDLNSHSLKAVEPLNIVDVAVANVSTSVALTQQAITAFVSTPTTAPVDAISLTPTPFPSDTSRVTDTATPLQPTRTRRARVVNTARPLPTRTPLPAATSTPLPPPPTDTEPPPTPLPPPTDTEPPPTPLPPPPDTAPPPTEPPIQILDTTPTAP